MPKAAWGGDFGKDAETAEGGDFAPYDGPTPKKGVYITRMKMFRLKLNKNDDHMLNGLFVVDEPKSSPKSKYNGYPMWWNGNITEQGAGYINAFLDVFGWDRKAFWSGKVIHDGDGDGDKTLGNVTKIGAKSVKLDILVKVNGTPNTYNGETNLQVGGFLGLEKSRPSEEDEDEYDDEEEYDEEEEAEEDVDDEEDEDEDYDEDEEDEEEDEEPEPPERARSTSRTAGTSAKPAAKAAPARRAAAKAPAKASTSPRSRRKPAEDDEPPF